MATNQHFLLSGSSEKPTHFEKHMVTGQCLRSSRALLPRFSFEISIKMGAGASSLPRVRKALLIRAHNMRAADQTLIDQFLPFAFRGPDHQMHILPSQIQNCLNMNKTDYFWLEDLLKTLFTPSDPLLASSSSSGKVQAVLLACCLKLTINAGREGSEAI